MKTRKATAGDIEVVLELLLEMYAEERDTLDSELKEPSLVRDYYRKLLSERLSGDEAIVVLAEEGKPIGFAVAYLTEDDLHTYSTKAYIRNIYVGKRFRKKGAGSLLLSEILSWAEKKGAEVVEADAYPKNKEGLSFWSKAGFKPKFTLIAKKIR
jgi:GNAT superfamily N-acetyltransferase